MQVSYDVRGCDGVILPLMTAGCLVLSLVLGGGTRTGFLSDAVLQAAAVPLLAYALWCLHLRADAAPMRSALLLCLGLVLVPMLQLIPLPPSVWTKLPGRSTQIESFSLLGIAQPWLPVSVSPRATSLALAAFVVPLAVFVGTCQLSFATRRKLSLLVIGIGMLSVLLGLLQVAEGPSSRLRFFEITNPGEAVGVFANRNHFAALLNCLTLFAAAWTVSYARVFEQVGAAQRFVPTTIVPLIAGFTLITVLVAAQAMARSRAGLGLTMLALLGGFLLASSGRSSIAGSKLAGRVLVGALVLAMVFSVQLALYRVLERFDADPLADARIPFARNTLTAAKAYAPLGSGIGTFAPVYAQFEQPRDALVEAYVNRAHNDVLEILLETGAVGAVLAALCLVWFARRSFEVWRARADETSRLEGSARAGKPNPRSRSLFAPGEFEIDRIMARAATIVVVLLLAHSLFDYPLRTGAMASMMSFALALLVPPPISRDAASVLRGERQGADRRADSARAGAPAAEAPPAAAAAAPRAVPPPRPFASSSGGRTPWDAEWPEAWRRPAKRPGAEPDGGEGGGAK